MVDMERFQVIIEDLTLCDTMGITMFTFGWEVPGRALKWLRHEALEIEAGFEFECFLQAPLTKLNK